MLQKCLTTTYRVLLFSRHFNSRSREGNDQEKMANSAHFRISIHVPARGTTAILPNFRLYLFSNICIFAYILFLLLPQLNHLFFSKLIFVQLFRCESPNSFMSTPYSHTNHIIRMPSAGVPLSTPTCSTFVLY